MIEAHHASKSFISPTNHQPYRFFLCGEEAGRVVAAAHDLNDGGINVNEEIPSDEAREGPDLFEFGEETPPGSDTPRPAEAAQGEDVQEESQRTKTGPFHYKPTEEEVENHRLCHHPFRSWCPHCIRGKALGEQHRRCGHKSRVPIGGVDYFFLTSGDGEQEELVKLRGELDMDDATVNQERHAGRLVKCLLFRCHTSKAVFAWTIPYKGDGEDGYVTGLLVTALKWLGYTRYILKSDNEPALLAMAHAAMKMARVEIPEMEQLTEEHPTAYDSQANGATEVGVRAMRGDIRTARSDLEDRLGAQVPISHPIMAWLVRHVGFTRTAFVRQSDGRTPWETIRGRPYSQRLYHFGERVHWKLPTKGPKSQPRGNASDMWQAGIYLGNEYLNNSYIVSTGSTTVSSRAVIRFPGAERWSKPTVEGVTAYPWSGHEPPAPRVQFKDAPEFVRATDVAEPKAMRRLRINPSDLDQFGFTTGCTQCQHVMDHGRPRAGITHSDTCRARIQAELMNTPEGRMRLEAHEEKINERMARHVEQHSSPPGGGRTPRRSGS